jgi:hypothetical protein
MVFSIVCFGLSLITLIYLSLRIIARSEDRNMDSTAFEKEKKYIVYAAVILVLSAWGIFYLP